MYRSGVVGVFVDIRGKVLVGERSRIPGAWQFPQGGIEDCEACEAAVLREVREELGIENATILRRGDVTTRYQFPENHRPFSGKCLGQEQTWFLLSTGSDPDLTKADGEFSNWKWADVAEVVQGVVFWKQAAYREGLQSLGLLSSGEG